MFYLEKQDEEEPEVIKSKTKEKGQQFFNPSKDIDNLDFVLIKEEKPKSSTVIIPQETLGRKKFTNSSNPGKSKN